MRHSTHSFSWCTMIHARWISPRRSFFLLFTLPPSFFFSFSLSLSLSLSQSVGNRWKENVEINYFCHLSIWNAHARWRTHQMDTNHDNGQYTFNNKKLCQCQSMFIQAKTTSMLSLVYWAQDAYEQISSVVFTKLKWKEKEEEKKRSQFPLFVFIVYVALRKIGNSLW